ncbi:MAG: MgtC/SapB family protein [Saccharofermentanales bacterium]
MELAYTDILVRLGIAVVVGFFIGLEREQHHRPAGIKTHILVCMGATVVSLIQIEMVADIIGKVNANPALADVLKTDYGRLGAQVISGIGFLGAGTILRAKGSIKGLTTAATLWLVACVGLGIGMGYYFISVSAAVLVMLLLTLLRFFQKYFAQRKGLKEIDVLLVNKKETMSLIAEYFQSKDIRVSSIDFPEEQDEIEHHGKIAVHCIYKISLPRTMTARNAVMDLCMEDDIIRITEVE